MKIAIVIGHHYRSKGAFSKHLQVSEWDFYNQVVQCIPEHSSNYSIDIYHHDGDIGGYVTRVKNTARKLNKIDYDLVMELHFNASSDPRANGCETLYYFASRKGRDYALKFSDVVTEFTGIRVRNGGLKALTNKRDRGFASVYYTKAPTILIEPFFGSSAIDCERIKDAEFMAKIITHYLETL